MAKKPKCYKCLYSKYMPDTFTYTMQDCIECIERARKDIDNGKAVCTRILQK